MMYFMVEGNLSDPKKITPDLMQEHMAYTQKALDAGMFLFSGLKETMDGGLFILKAESQQEVEQYLSNEPFAREGIQSYRMVSFNAHYTNPLAKAWFE